MTEDVQNSRDAATEKAQELQGELADRFEELRRSADGYYASADESLRANRQAAEAVVGHVSERVSSLAEAKRRQLDHHDQQIRLLGANADHHEALLERLRAEYGEEIAQREQQAQARLRAAATQLERRVVEVQRLEGERAAKLAQIVREDQDHFGLVCKRAHG
jgi:arginine utilization protein RocB